MDGGIVPNAKPEGQDRTNNSVRLTRMRWKSTHSDHSDQDDDEDCPGQRVRKDAYNRMVEHHKDNIFQQKEEADINNIINNIKRNQDAHNEDQMHKY
eukprot:1431522-Heterocapsa_arctica.AAC.1